MVVNYFGSSFFDIDLKFMKGCFRQIIGLELKIAVKKKNKLTSGKFIRQEFSG
jgi:hypothetical protein